MLFADRISGRKKAKLLKMSLEEVKFLEDEASRRGISVNSLIRKCLRTLVPKALRNSNVENRT